MHGGWGSNACTGFSSKHRVAVRLHEMVFDAADKRWCLMPSTTNSSREQLDFFRQSVNPSPGAVLRSLMIDSVRRNQDRLTMSAASQARNQCTWLQWPARAWSDTRLFRDRFQSFCMLQIWRLFQVLSSPAQQTPITQMFCVSCPHGRSSGSKCRVCSLRAI